MKKTAFVLYCFFFLSSLAMQSQNAPVTTTGTNINAVPGTTPAPIPVTVTGFSNIGQFTLTITFDTTRLYFVSATINPSLAGMSVTYYSPSGNTQGKLIFTWTSASNVSLTDGSVLSNVTFYYVSGTGNLNWAYIFGSVCQYKRWVSGTLTLLNDTPKYLFYLNGGISNISAPVTYAPVITMTGTGTLSAPITVNGFTNIEDFTLYLDYDPLILTYNSFTKNSAFGSSFLVGDNPGTGGLRELHIQWYGSVVTLSNGSTLCTLNFTYSTTNGTGCFLSWFDNGPSCEYDDGYGSELIDMPTTTYYKNGSVSPPLVTDFTASNLFPPKNTTVSFTDLSTGGPTLWTWSFDRTTVVYVNATNSHSQNPQVQFTDGGLYSVTLNVSNPYLTDSLVKSAYLRAGTPGLWTGNTSADWSITTNWDNWLVPGSSIDVVIPASTSHWPVFTGNLTLGVQCKNITLNGASQLSVTGNLTINPTYTLTVNGSGYLKVGADWSDSGTFIPGTGIVEFNGSDPGSILLPVSETFYNLIENKTNATLTLYQNIIVNGNLTVQ